MKFVSERYITCMTVLSGNRHDECMYFCVCADLVNKVGADSELPSWKAWTTKPRRGPSVSVPLQMTHTSDATKGKNIGYVVLIAQFQAVK